MMDNGFTGRSEGPTSEIVPSSHDPLPAGVTNYTDENPPTGSDEIASKYWFQRKWLFNRYDEGIWMTTTAWFEVTPEKIAAKIAEQISMVDSISCVIDGFCGVGGNTIQFALSPKCKKVVAIDKDPAAIDCARHNADIYGVSDKIEFLQGDFLELIEGRLKDIEANAIFLSPPWGGPDYREDAIFDLETMKPYPGSLLFHAAEKITANIAFYIPRSSDLNQLAKLVPDGTKIQAVHYCKEQKSKAITAYFGALSIVEESKDIDMVYS